MKCRVVIQKQNDQISFFLQLKSNTQYLCRQAFSKGVYVFFKNGRAEAEILSFKGWGKNPRLDKTIEKLPIYIRYVKKEILGLQ